MPWECFEYLSFCINNNPVSSSSQNHSLFPVHAYLSRWLNFFGKKLGEFAMMLQSPSSRGMITHYGSECENWLMSGNWSRSHRFTMGKAHLSYLSLLDVFWSYMLSGVFTDCPSLLVLGKPCSLNHFHITLGSWPLSCHSNLPPITVIRLTLVIKIKCGYLSSFIPCSYLPPCYYIASPTIWTTSELYNILVPSLIHSLPPYKMDWPLHMLVVLTFTQLVYAKIYIIGGMVVINEVSAWCEGLSDKTFASLEDFA